MCGKTQSEAARLRLRPAPRRGAGPDRLPDAMRRALTHSILGTARWWNRHGSLGMRVQPLSSPADLRASASRGSATGRIVLAVPFELCETTPATLEVTGLKSCTCDDPPCLSVRERKGFVTVLLLPSADLDPGNYDL